jgi:hypothetical protein
MKLELNEQVHGGRKRKYLQRSGLNISGDCDVALEQL